MRRIFFGTLCLALAACGRTTTAPSVDAGPNIEQASLRFSFCSAVDMARSTVRYHLAVAQRNAMGDTVRERCLHRVAQLRQAESFLLGFMSGATVAAMAVKIDPVAWDPLPLARAAETIEESCAIDPPEVTAKALAELALKNDAVFEQQLQGCSARGYHSPVNAVDAGPPR